MDTAGIRDVKNNLSRYLARVKAGEEVLITERGKPIARIIKEPGGDMTLRKRLAPLIQKGLVTMPTRTIDRASLPRLTVSGKPASELVLEDRR
jgi:antitoxin (DNA-binding transcriptional repressor) of toxin-antitoxin stability system